MSEEVIATAGDVDPDPLELFAALDALRHLLRGEVTRAEVGPPWGITVDRLESRRVNLTWAALAMAGTFAARIAADNNVTVEALLDGYRPGVPKGFGTDLTVSPRRLVKTVREMVRDGDNRIVRTVDL